VRQVLPKVPKSASDTITGTVRVRVKVSVDPSGKVEQASLDSPGPSRYFARLALEAARQWEFSPHTNPGTWLLQFEFRKDSLRAVPTRSGERG
jgi:TonB family protein